jgi:ATP-dependent Lhr-like helicase
VDPANPFGAIIAWPQFDPDRSKLRPTRRAGALVALRGGELLGWLDPNGANLITFTDEEREDAPTLDNRVELLRAFARARVRFAERSRSILASIDGASLMGVSVGSASGGLWVQAAQQAGLTEVPRGWRWPTDA